jgi:excisionase family DNA binding protein
MAGMTSEREFLAIEEVLAVLRVSRSTFCRWRRQGQGPVIIRLPGGGVRIRRSALDRWLRTAGRSHGRTLAARGVVPLEPAGVKAADGRQRAGC